MTEVKALEPAAGQTATVKAATIGKLEGQGDSSESYTRTCKFTDRRLAREWITIAAMVRIYCRDQHAFHSGLCTDCVQLLDYATLRLERCRFGAEKPTCANCPVHCYQRNRRDQVKAVMRYAGPKMLFRHPWLSLWHWLDGFRKAPAAGEDTSDYGSHCAR